MESTVSIKVDQLKRNDLLYLEVGESIELESLDQYTGGKYLDIPRKIDELFQTKLINTWHLFKNIAVIISDRQTYEIINGGTKYFELTRTE